jgi:hypothetical protein
MIWDARGISTVRAELVEARAALPALDAILRVTCAGICGSDLHLLHGLAPSYSTASIWAWSCWSLKWRVWIAPQGQATAQQPHALHAAPMILLRFFTSSKTMAV